MLPPELEMAIVQVDRQRFLAIFCLFILSKLIFADSLTESAADQKNFGGPVVVSATVFAPGVEFVWEVLIPVAAKFLVGQYRVELKT